MLREENKMVNIIIVLIVLGIVISILVWIADHIKGILWGAVVIVFLGICFWLIENHITAFMFLIGGIVIIIISYLIWQASNTVLASSKNYMKVNSENRLQQNEEKLLQKLTDIASKNKIGFITMQDVEKMLSRYSNKKYPLDMTFSAIVAEFINDSEKQNFVNNKKWAEPYVQYIISIGVRSLSQLLEEIDGPLRHFMHFTPDETLLYKALDEYTLKKDVDTPAILTKSEINGTIVYQPTDYGIRLYNGTLSHSESEEIDFDTL